MERVVAKTRLGLLLGAVLVSAIFKSEPVYACGPDIVVTFTESAPDIIRIENNSKQWTIIDVTFDLTSSQGGLFVDSVFGGSGYGGAMGFRQSSGNVQLLTQPAMSDGDSVMVMLFQGFTPGEIFSFGIDLDDRLVNSEWGPTQISGNEILGARVVAKLRADDGRQITSTGVFSDQNKAELISLSCV